MGLRARVVGAMLLTALVTLAAAALTILPPLEQRLESNRLAELRGLARTARPALERVPADDIAPRSATLRRIIERLARRTGGRIAIYDELGRRLADTARIGRPIGPAVLARNKQRARRHRDRVASGEERGRAFALTVVHAGEGHVLTLVIAKRLDDTRAAASVVRAASPLAAIVAIGLAIGVALLLSRGLLRRLRRLHADAVALGHEGLRHQIAVDGSDEVAEVAGALEAMRVRLVEEEASRQAFVSTASHELRTPLASLQATLELLREEVLAGPASPTATADRADIALRQTHRLVGLATDLLDLSRVDGDVPLSPELVDVGELVDVVAPEFAARLGKRLTVVRDRAIALADPAAVVRIVRILLDNASAYGAGRVGVTVAADDGAVRVVVDDEGPGIADAERERIFVRFARGDAAASAPGSGLGLAIARGLARAMGGEVSSEPAAGGARFVLELPSETPRSP